MIEVLTPRDAALNRLALGLLLAAGANGLMGLLLAAAALVGADTSGLAQALAGGLGPHALLLLVIGLLANAGVCLLLATSVLAQESVAWVLVGGLLMCNGLALAGWAYWPAVLALLPGGWALWHMLRDRTAFHSNPVTVKELRGRMRGVRSFAIITVFLMLMGIFTVLLYLLALSQITGSTVIETGQLGRALFRGVVGVELALIVLIVPALTAGAISGERERHTYDLLTTTLLPVPTFLVGKMISALGYMALLVLAAIPLQSVAFLFGGVSQTEILLAVVGLMATALLLAALGLFFSATTERTLQATIRVYVAAIVVMVGLPVLSSVLFSGAFGYAINGVGLPSASAAQEARAIYADMLMTGLNPVTSALYTQQILVNHQSPLLFSVRLASSGELLPVVAPWAILVVTYLAAAGVLLLAAVHAMRPRDRA
jgi:ABC-type transport system involved in multi-copper enzyme maturation permease subunit